LQASFQFGDVIWRKRSILWAILLTTLLFLLGTFCAVSPPAQAAIIARAQSGRDHRTNEGIPMKIATLTLLSLFIASAGFAATLNVPGTYATIQACVNAAQPGDTCVVAAGSYAGANMVRSGAAGQRITIQAASGTQPTLTGSINVGTNDYITIQGFTFNGTTITASAGASYLKIIGNSFNNTGLRVGLAPVADHVLIDGNKFGPNMNDDDINQWGQFWVIRNNEAIGITQTTQHPDFWQTYCSGAGTVGAFTLIENNYAHDCVGGDCHFMQLNSATCTTQTLTNYIVRQNKTKSIPSYFVGFQNNGGSMGKLAVYNNTIGDQTLDTNLVNQLDASPSFDKNNIAYESMSFATQMGFVFPVGTTLKNALVYYPGHTITTRDNLTTCVSSGGCKINQNPKLNSYATGDFSLQAGSPAIDAGTSITTVASGDAGSGATLKVSDAYAFQDGTWVDGINADCISVKTVGNHICVTSINYSTNTITLASDPGPRSVGDSVWLYSNSNSTVVLNGSAPDMGAVESPFSQGVVAPTSPTNLRIVP